MIVKWLPLPNEYRLIAYLIEEKSGKNSVEVQLVAGENDIIAQVTTDDPAFPLPVVAKFLDQIPNKHWNQLGYRPSALFVTTVRVFIELFILAYWQKGD